jgi:uncharacterized membrane protein YbhN (UPF0104 family)
VNLKRTAMIALPLAGLIASVLFLVYTVDLGAAFGAISRASPMWIAIACGVSISLLGLAGLRLWSLLSTAGRPVPFRRCQSAVLAATTLNSVLPGRGGDLVKALFLTSDTSQARILTGVMVVERAVDLLVLAVYSAFAAALAERYQLALVSGGLAIAAIGGMIVLAASHGRWKLPLLGERFGHAAYELLTRPRRAVLAIAMSALFWAVNVCLFWCLFRAVGATASLGDVAAAGPLALLTGALPLSIGGMGTRDAAMVALMNDRVPEATVLAASLLYTVIGNWLLAAIGVFSLGTHTLAALRSSAAAAKGAP